MNKVLLLLFLALPVLVTAQLGSPLTPHGPIIGSTFKIEVGKGFGTCFLVKKKSDFYFITAKHILTGGLGKINNGGKYPIKIHTNDGIIQNSFNVYFHKNDTVDIAVIPLRATVNINSPVILTTAPSLDMGQECYFLGFPGVNTPNGLSTQVGNLKVPIYKRAFISGGLFLDKRQIFLLDGHNNRGFSGGPVVSTNSDYKNQFIMAVISGYYPDPQVIELPKDSATAPIKSVIYGENSGIIVAFPIFFAIEIIDQMK
jgi:hypothetical protein